VMIMLLDDTSRTERVTGSMGASASLGEKYGTVRVFLRMYLLTVNHFLLTILCHSVYNWVNLYIPNTPSISGLQVLAQYEVYPGEKLTITKDSSRGRIQLLPMPPALY
jgi:hypothetical protein